MSEELNEGFTESEALQAIEEKLEEREFLQEISEDQPEEFMQEADTGEESQEYEQAPVIAQAQMAATYDALQRDAHLLAAAMANVENLRHSNPSEYAIAMNQLTAAQQDLARREQDFTRSYQRQVTETVSKEKAKLLKAIPEWKNPEFAEKEKAEILSFLRQRGYTDAEIAHATARDILTARDAMLLTRQANTSQAGNRKTIPFKKPARSNAIPGVDPVAQKYMERNIKHGTADDIELRLIRSGHV